MVAPQVQAGTTAPERIAEPAGTRAEHWEAARYTSRSGGEQ